MQQDISSRKGGFVGTSTQAVGQDALDVDLEKQLEYIIRNAGLRRPENEFFSRASAISTVSPVAALTLARQWQAVTKTFMFTTIAGLGAMAREMNDRQETNRVVLAAFQTAYRVIGDDLCNLAPVFAAVSPKGAGGVHFLWWADSITSPLAAAVPEAASGTRDELGEGVTGLMERMTMLADRPIGPAVQLRVVESIALDIAVAFRRIYAKTLVHGQKVFPTARSLSWIDSHIKAETAHAKSVSDDEVGMTAFVESEAELTLFPAMAEEYSLDWARALREFSEILTT